MIEDSQYTAQWEVDGRPYEIVFNHPTMGLSQNHKSLLRGCVQTLLERVPPEVLDLPRSSYQWIWRAAEKVAKSRDQSLRPSFPMPYLFKDYRSHYRYCLQIAGFDAIAQKPWSRRFEVTIPCQPFSDAYKEFDTDGYEWEVIDQGISSKDSGLDYSACQEALLYAQWLLVNYTGWVGTFEDFETECFTRRLKTSRNRRKLLAAGSALCRRQAAIPKRKSQSYLIVSQHTIGTYNIPASQFRPIRGLTSVEMWTVVDVFFQALRRQEDPLVAWGLACHEADEIRRLTSEKVPHRTPTPCTGDGCSEKLHVCRQCIVLKECKHMVDDGIDGRVICTGCARKALAKPLAALAKPLAALAGGTLSHYGPFAMSRI